MLSPLTVWYNTKCPVCDGGIRRQQRRLIDAARSGAIVFQDINMEPDALQSYWIGLEDIRRRLHGRDEAGQLYIGADCAIEMWRRTPGHTWRATLLKLPVVQQFARFGYNRLADVLYAWNRRRKHW